MPSRLFATARVIAAIATAVSAAVFAQAQTPPAPAGLGASSATQPQTKPAAVVYPDIPVPEIKTNFRPLPTVDQLPDRPAMPDVMTMNDGTKVTTPAQWQQRRAEMREILEYYSTGHAPPAPGNVKGREVRSQIVAGGKVKYRLVHLTFGPDEKLFLDIGIYTPTTGGPFATVIMPEFGSPPGATVLPVLPPEVVPPKGQHGPIMTYVGTDPNPAASARPPVPRRAPVSSPATNGAAPRGPATQGAANPTAATSRPATRPSFGFGATDPEAAVASNEAIRHGFAYVTFNYSDCGEDSRLRLPDGSWAYRTTRFFPAYPGYDWGLIRAWGWGASRVVDYLETDPSFDKSKLIISGISRLGKCALYTGAFDDRFSMVAPVASAGLGTPAMRFSGPNRGGREGLITMMVNFPNQSGPRLYQFKDQVDKLPFDQHWFIALVAPRPFVDLEAADDTTANSNGIRQSYLAAKPAYDFLGVPDHIGVHWSTRPHGMVAEDWQGMFAFADKFLFHKKVDIDYTQFPAAAYPPATQKNP